MLIDKQFYSDLHSGNVFFDKSCKDNLKLGIIDFGRTRTNTIPYGTEASAAG